MNEVNKTNYNHGIDRKRTDWKIILGILSCLGLVVMFDETMILPAIPDFIREFNISYSTATWILSAYIISGAVMTPIAGKLSDIYGKKRILLIIMAVYAVGIISGRFATGIELMIISRLAQGIGLAMFPIAFAIIRDLLPEKKLAIGQTIFGSTFSGGAIVGVIVGAIIIQNYGWQATFFSIFPFAISLWFIIWRFIKLDENNVQIKITTKDTNNDSFRSKDSKNKIENETKDIEMDSSTTSSINLSNIQKMDLKGTIVLALTVVSFLAGITMLENKDADSDLVIGCLFLVSAISIVGFISIERKASLPLFDLKLMKNRLFITPIIILMFVSMSIFMVYQTIPLMVRTPPPLGFGGDAIDSANIQLPFMIVLFIGTILSGFLLNKIGNIRLLGFGTAISTFGFLFLLMLHSTELSVSIGLTIIACGIALSMAGVFNVILLSVPIQVTGIALGMTMLLNLIGMSVGPALAGVYQQMNQAAIHGINGLYPTTNAYYMIFLTALVLSSISLVMTILISRENKKKIINEIPIIKKHQKSKDREGD
ncbi:MAG: MFS transporter [Candidatus Nitrosocosmicus sp.]|nr:MFS transporter [Candidatus Nitrosocosmicus sp.]